MLMFGHDKAVADFVAGHAPLEVPDFGSGYVGIGILNATGGLIGGVVYHDHRPRWGTVQLSGAAVTPKAASTRHAFEIISFGFGQLGVQKIWTQSGRSNTRALRLLKWAGFRQEAVLAHEYGDEHCVRMRLLRKEWDRGERKAA